MISSPVAGEVLTDCLTRRLENNGQLLKIGRKATETITRGNLLVQSRKNCADSLKLHITMWKAMNFLMAVVDNHMWLYERNSQRQPQMCWSKGLMWQISAFWSILEHF